MRKIAVTAANGLLGSEIINALIKINGNQQVIGLARTPAKAEHLGVEIKAGDYNSKEDLQKSLIGIDTVLIVSGNDVPEKRIGQHRNIIKAAQSTGVKKIVYTSIQGLEEGTTFSPIVHSNRQTEEDVKNSGLEWVIGRNGLYIEPDVDYMIEYQKIGAVKNCAGDGKCGYTTRSELGFAYAKMLIEEKHHGKTYNLHGDLLSQYELVEFLNLAFETTLKYVPLTVEEFLHDRTNELGEFFGNIISGIYVGIANGAFKQPSHYPEAAGRVHISWEEYFKSLQV